MHEMAEHVILTRESSFASKLVNHHLHASFNLYFGSCLFFGDSSASESDDDDELDEDEDDEEEDELLLLLLDEDDRFFFFDFLKQKERDCALRPQSPKT